VVAGLIIASPLFGAVLAGLLIGIVLLIVGIEMISAGIGGRERLGSLHLALKNRFL
jgi:uncharacterized membrane protein HdeD (DUF308 family)